MIILMMMMMILMMILMILMILMMKRHLYKACLNWLTSVRLIIVLRIITRILVRIILRICPVSRMRIRPVSGIWFRAKNPYSSPTIMPLSFLSIFITFWFSNRLIFTRTEFFREWISNFTSTIWRDFIDKCWNNSILNALTRWFHEKSCQNKVVTILQFSKMMKFHSLLFFDFRIDWSLLRSFIWMNFKFHINDLTRFYRWIPK